MKPLNFPEYSFRTRTEHHKRQIFDVYRRKFVALTPEEWVRQHVLRWLVEEKQYASGLLRVECSLPAGDSLWRADAVFFNSSAQPALVVECKAPEVTVTQDVFDQIARYNFLLRSSALLVTNGLSHYCCRIDYTRLSYTFLKEVPRWDELLTFSVG
ncbi:MAG: type I restriction enzyme HsdR N-terminal domain-containing protein [Bacteroidales bacterium]